MNYRRIMLKNEYNDDCLVILDNKRQCFRVFEGDKVIKEHEYTFRYIINSKRLTAFNNKNVEELQKLIFNDKCLPVKDNEGFFLA